jgi:hypothetical protein
MRRIIIIAGLAAVMALAVTAALTTRGHKAQADTRPAAAFSHSAPSHARAFWVAHHKQP